MDEEEITKLCLSVLEEEEENKKIIVKESDVQLFHDSKVYVFNDSYHTIYMDPLGIFKGSDVNKKTQNLDWTHAYCKINNMVLEINRKSKKQTKQHYFFASKEYQDRFDKNFPTDEIFLKANKKDKKKYYLFKDYWNWEDKKNNNKLLVVIESKEQIKDQNIIYFTFFENNYYYVIHGLTTKNKIISDESLIKKLFPSEYHTFSAIEWGLSKYIGKEIGMSKIRSLAKYQQIEWLHAYCPEQNFVIDFHRSSDKFFHKKNSQPTEEYKNRLGIFISYLNKKKTTRNVIF